MAKKKIVQSRLLTSQEIQILRFLWKWKMSNTIALKQWISPNASFWKFYKRLRYLINEGYVKQVQDPGLDTPVWTLTKKGFSFLFGGSEDLEQKRFVIQSLVHDFWNTAFHLGDFLLECPANVELLSEQEINAKKPEVLPDWVPKGKQHIPDGYTKFQSADKKTLVAFEIETSVKTSQRYEEMIHYLDMKSEIDLVFWLCENDNLVAKITQQIIASKRFNVIKHNFVLLSDFQKLGWNCPIVWGGKAKATVSEVMGQLAGNIPVNKAATCRQPNVVEIFCSKLKSPRGLKT